MVKEKLERIEKDMKEMNGQFDINSLPEVYACNQVDSDIKSMFLTIGVSLLYNRKAKPLWEKCLKIYEDDKDFFVSSDNYTKEELEEKTKDLNFRYYNKDSRVWYENMSIIEEKYGTVDSMIEEADENAPKLVRKLREDEFLCLKGEKLAPFYAKVVDMNLHSLSGIWELDIPVDTHISRLSRDLMRDPDASDDEIREWWRKRDCSIMVVDTALWLIGNNWNEWGKRYWESI